jgi:hypothetical protein
MFCTIETKSQRHRSLGGRNQPHGCGETGIMPDDGQIAWYLDRLQLVPYALLQGVV